VVYTVAWPLFGRYSLRLSHMREMGFNGFFSSRKRVGRRRGAAGRGVADAPGPSYGLSPDDPYDAIDRLPADRA
jgi:hypothetical protein